MKNPASLKIRVNSRSIDLCKVICEFLIGNGHEVQCCHDLNEFVRLASENPVDLAIIEVGNPEQEAIEAVGRLQRTSLGRHTPLIVISDFPDLEHELPQIFDFIQKPVDLVRLKEDTTILASGSSRRVAAVKHLHLTHEEHQKFHDFLILHSGLHFERRNIKILERGLEARMSALRILTCEDYYQYLLKNMDSRGELQKLVQHLTVGETFFFRYHAHFEALRQNIIPDLVFGKRKEKIRIWSAGCSTGEEPYSIAMAIMEALPDWKKRDIRIIATDINSRSIKRAKDGVFSAWKVRMTEQAYLDRYFKRIGESYLVKDEVKSLVDFSYFNLQVDRPPENEKFDAIFCRNVMIYFTTASIKKLLESFASALDSGGHLFLGHSETLAHISTRFERHIHGGSFYYRKRSDLPDPQIQPKPVTAVNPEKPVMAVKEARQKAPKPPEQVSPVEIKVETLQSRGEQLLDQENYSEASLLFAKVLKQEPNHARATLGMGIVQLAANMPEKALESFNRAIELDDLMADGYFMRGMLFEMLEKTEKALEEYRKAVLLDMDFIMPHYRIWRLSLAAEDFKTATREQKNCIKFLEKCRREALVPYSGGLSREIFLHQLREEIERVEIPEG